MTRKRTCPACGGRGDKIEREMSGRMYLAPCDGCAGTGRIGSRPDVTSAREMARILRGDRT